MDKILIANRGEVALRVMKTAQKMGIKTVAVYSDADRHAPHVIFADQAVYIGPSPASQSYLVIDRIINAAKESGADAIHPGYGFLSENADFARACQSNEITFIGPSHHAIEVMGSKLAAKEAVKSYNIPMVPGVDRAITDPEEAVVIAEEIGYPVLIKASAGGGGKGMRIVTSSDELKEQMQRAISEAKSAFGDGSVFIERYVNSPRHIEIQILADNHGHVVHLFERECSIQRRHQKVVEEAPSSVVSVAMRQAMGEAAISVAKACDYRGVGTVEFLVDEQLNFFFLEMNTRLQVEHPVTEMITGLDLVEQQIKVARGDELAFKQEDLIISGHALELRVYAEDPKDNFMPSIGTLETYRLPKGEGIRVDDGFREGMEIPIHYDPMIAKLIVHSDTRQQAIDLLQKAINDYHIEGIETTLSFGSFVCAHEAFRSGDFDTHFVKNYYQKETTETPPTIEEKIAAFIALKSYEEEKNKLVLPRPQSSNWTSRSE